MKILAISDQHGYLPDIPECDLLILAGDLCPNIFMNRKAQGNHEPQWQWFLDKWLPWRYRQPVGACVITWGNHDWCGEGQHSSFADGEGAKYTVVACDDLVTCNGINIWLTPWSNQFMRWAFMQESEELAKVYSKIPSGIDILVSHQPPIGYGSECTYMDPRSGYIRTEHVGSIELLAQIKEKRPHAVVCGHIHSGFGKYDCDGIPVYNVSVVDEGYKLTNKPTVIELS